MSKMSKYLAWERLSPGERELIIKIKESFSDKVEEKEVKKKSFSPSRVVYAHGGCPRFWYQMFHGTHIKEVYTHTDQRSMSSGRSSHEDLQEKLQAGSLVVSLEQKLTYDDPPIMSFADAVIKVDGKLLPVEIKTARSEAYEARERNFQGTDYHTLQLLFYMKMLDADKGFLLYENRNTFENIIVPVFMTEENSKIVEDAFEWMRQVRAASDADTVPKFFKGRRINSKICTGCPIRKECDELGHGVVDLPLLKDFH